MNIEKVFLTTKDDLVGFYRGWYRFNHGVLYTLIFAALTIVGAIRFFTDAGSENLLLAFIGIAGIAFFAWSPYNMSKKMITQNAFFKKDITIHVSPEGLKQETCSSNVFLKWEEAFDFFESKNTIAIYISQAQAYVLPKRVFTADETAEISSIIRSSIIPKSKKWRKTLTTAILSFLLAIFVLAQIGILILSHIL